MKNAFEYEAELAALREELDDKLQTIFRLSGEVQKSNQRTYEAEQRLADAEQRNAELEKQVSEFPTIYINGCNFQGYNPDGSLVFEYTEGPIKRIKSIRMIDWYCEGPKPTESGASE